LATKISDVIGEQLTATSNPSAALVDTRQQLAVGNSGTLRVFWSGDRRAIVGLGMATSIAVKCTKILGRGKPKLWVCNRK